MIMIGVFVSYTSWHG